MRKQYTEAQRAALIGLVAAGSTPRAAAAQLGVAEPTAYYWLKHAGRRRLARSPRVLGPRIPAREPSAQPTFARLVREAEAPCAITLRAGGVVIEVQPGFDPALLREVIAALVEGAP